MSSVSFGSADTNFFIFLIVSFFKFDKESPDEKDVYFS